MTRFTSILLFLNLLVAVTIAEDNVPEDINGFIDGIVASALEKDADKLNPIRKSGELFKFDHIGPIPLPISIEQVSEVEVYGVPSLNRTGDATRTKIGQNDQTFLPLGITDLRIEMYEIISAERDNREYFKLSHHMNLTIAIEHLAFEIVLVGNKADKTLWVEDFTVTELTGLSIEFKGNYGDRIVNKVIDVSLSALHNKLMSFASSKGKQVLTEALNKAPDSVKTFFY